MRRLPLLAAGAALLAALAGCAGQIGGPPAGAPQLPAGDGPTTYTQIIEALWGTPADRLAAEARMTLAVQTGLADCMAETGHSYTPVPSEATSGGPITPGDLTSLAPIGVGFGLADMKRNVAIAADNTTNVGYTQLASQIERDAYGAALGRCLTAAPEPRMFSPEGQADITVELERLFKAIELLPEIAVQLDAYGGCVKAAGFPAVNYLELYQLIQGRFPDPSIGWRTLSTTSAWTQAAEFEARAATADATCRTDLRRQALTLAEPALRELVAKRADLLTKAAAGWAAHR